MNENQKAFYEALKVNLRTTSKQMCDVARERDELKRDLERGVYQNDYAQPKIKERDKLLAKMQEDGIRDAMAVIDRRVSALEAEKAIDPSMLNADAELLKLDLLNQGDIDAMMQRNRSNPTMARLIFDYANRHDLKAPHPQYLIDITENQKAANGSRSVVNMFMKNWAGNPDKAETMLNKFFEPFGV